MPRYMPYLGMPGRVGGACLGRYARHAPVYASPACPGCMPKSRCRRGLLTFVIGFTTFFMMPPSPTQSQTWFRPNGWFTEREETVIVSRVLRDDPTKVTYLCEYLFVLALTRRSRAICTIDKD